MVTFRPSSTGGKSASFTINSNASNVTSKVISLTGTGAGATSCTYSLSAATQSFGSGAGTGAFTVSAGSACAWTVTSGASWATITAPAGGQGTGQQSVSFALSANTGSLRIANITVQGGSQTLPFLVTQDGTGGSCIYDLSPTFQSFTSSAGSNSVTLSTSSTCGWSAASNAPWITLNTTGTHLGSGSISYSVVANPTNNLRLGTVTVSGETSASVLTVSQDGASNTCTYTLTPSQATVVNQGGFSYFGVGTAASCTWSASVSDSWLSIQNGSYGTGSGQVQFNIAQNLTTSSRVGSITVQGNGQTAVYTITQLGLPAYYPNISLPTTSFNIGNALTGATAYQTVTVQNTGNGVLYVGSIYLLSGTTEFSAPSSMPSVLPSGTGSFTISLTPASVGAKSATFRITSNDPSHPTVDVSVSATAVAPGSGGIDFLWSNQGTVPEGLAQTSYVTVGSAIYIYGGHEWRFDPTVPSWTDVDNTTVTPGGAAYINGSVYLKSDLDARVAIDQLSNDNWTFAPSMLDFRSGAAVASVNGLLYVIGGLSNGAFTGMVEVLDPSTGQWTQKTDMPTPRAYGSCAVVNNIIYVIGGITGQYSSATEAYDPSTDTWVKRENMPTARSIAAAAVLQNKIEVIGGHGFAGNTQMELANVEEFDPSKPDGPGGTRNAWAIRNPIGTARMGANAGTVNGAVYVAGGSTASSVNVLSVEVGTLSAGPAMVVPVTSVPFGDVSLGNAAEAEFTVQNSGNALLTLNYVWSAPIVEVTAPSSLAAGQAATVGVRILPTALGAQAVGLAINTNDPNSPLVNIGFTGNAVSPQAPPAGQNFSTVATYPLPGAGQPLYLTLSGGYAYVGLSEPSQLDVINLATGAVTATVPFSQHSSAETGLPAILNNRAYVPLAFTPADQLAVVDLTSNTVLQYIPTLPDPLSTAVWNNQIYVQASASYCGGLPKVVQVLDTTSNTFITTIPVGITSSWVAIDPVTGRGYAVGSSCNGMLPTVFDANTNTVTGNVDAPFGSNAIAISGTHAYMLENGVVDVVDIPSNGILARIPVDQFAGTITATPSYVFVGSQGSNAVYAISTVSNAVVAALPVSSPGGVAADPGTNTLYVVSTTSQSLVVIQVEQPDFSLGCPSSLTAAAGTSGSTTCSVTSVQGYNAAVALACSGLPQGSSCTFTPTPVTPPGNGTAQSTVLVAVPAGIVPGIYPFSVTGTDTSTTHTASLTITVPTCSFILPVTSQGFPAAGGSGAVAVNGTTGCPWTGTSNAAWITITAGTPGNGNGSASFTVAANTASAGRTGTMTLAGQTFTVNQAAPNYTISGKVTVNGSGLSGVTVGLTNGTTSTTNGSGAYSFAKLKAGGNYTVTPSLTGYIFAPPNITFSNLGANETANFTTSSPSQKWIALQPSGTAPSARADASAIYIPTGDKMVIFGGNPQGCTSAPSLNDTWMLAGASGVTVTPSWTHVQPLGGPPPARRGHSAIYNAATDRMVLFGGDALGCSTHKYNDVWVLMNASGATGTPTWVRMSPAGTLPPARSEHAAVFDANANRMVVFGGDGASASFTDAWVLTHADGSGGKPQWTQLAPTGTTPTATGYTAATYDPSTHRMTVYSGRLCCQGPPTNATWVLTNATGTTGTSQWIKMAPTGPLPSPLVGPRGVYDTTGNYAAYFGGSGTNQIWFLARANGTSTMTWAQLVPQGTAPPGRGGVAANPAVVHDPGSQRTIIFGGKGPSGVLNDTWVVSAN